MNPLEKLAAAASRLIQVADGARDQQLSIALREISATIRGSVATIRAALEGQAQQQPRPAKFTTVLGDEDPPPVKAKRTRKRKAATTPPGTAA